MYDSTCTENIKIESHSLKQKMLCNNANVVRCFVFLPSSESENGETLQPPTGCMSGIFTWHNPTDSVNLAFPRSLLPEGSRHRMKVCLRPTIGAGVRDMFQVVGGRGRRGRRPGELRLNTDTTDAGKIKTHHVFRFWFHK